MKHYLSVCLIFLAQVYVYSQGCSDAGICYFSTPSNDVELNDQNKNSIEAGLIFGKGLEDVSYVNGYLSYRRTFSEKVSLAGKITYNQANGSFGTLGQFGDAFIIGNYQLTKKEKSNLTAVLGLKLPFTFGNLKINNISLPMDYQASLGTFDLLAGLEYNYSNWSLNTAVQIPVFNTNKNSYFDDFSASDDFPTTNLFERKSDLLLRVTRVLKSKSGKWILKPNVLTIYHLGNDYYRDVFNERQVINESSGLTVNINLITTYKINDVNSIEVSLATPLLVREIRPDGLTRSFTAGISYNYNF